MKLFTVFAPTPFTPHVHLFTCGWFVAVFNWFSLRGYRA